MSISSRTSDQSGSKRRKVVGEVSYFGLTDCGCVRPLNEDAWYASPEDGLFLVSDGMGGESAGALASEIVVEVLPLMIRQRLKGVTGLAMETRKRVCAALVDLSVELRRRTQGQSGLDGAGATIVLALVRGRHAVIAHLGDSRAYLFRRGSLEQLTKDHSLVRLLIESGDVKLEDARNHPARSQLTRYAGMKGEPLPEVRLVALRPGDRLLLCTDGLTGMVKDMEIFGILRKNLSTRKTCQWLVSAANEAGGRDNITVVMADVT